MKSYSYSFTTNQPPKEVFDVLLNIKQWWSGFYNETVSGSSKEVGDEFSFHAGGGMHITRQKLIEVIPDKKIVWEVTESNLSFLENTKEWQGTKLVFDISETANKTQVTFTHQGLEPQIECYGPCSSAWSEYLQQLEEKFQNL